MSNTVEKPFLGLLAGIALLADLITLGQFVLSGTFEEFWTSQWVLGIVFIVTLLVVGVSFLILAGKEDIISDVVPFFGGIYMLLAMGFYLFFGFLQSQGEVSFGDFVGGGLLLIVLIAISIICIAFAKSKEFFILSSYGPATCSLLFAFIIIYKYIFNAVTFEFGVFSGELILLISGALLFTAINYMASNCNDCS
uniref:Uncharacterized protein n=1 Tax=Candidatus Kentrum sp. DK TaxID=2126562 RepID=A0A450TQG6_9GAMM|nr:MAG: hypothetical protein BECKDK2373B_GA0170837_12741 [Candidatus Kentron sp. DK]